MVLTTYRESLGLRGRVGARHPPLLEDQPLPGRRDGLLVADEKMVDRVRGGARVQRDDVDVLHAVWSGTQN